jgi:hypothetical protein
MIGRYASPQSLALLDERSMDNQVFWFIDNRCGGVERLVCIHTRLLDVATRYNCATFWSSFPLLLKSSTESTVRDDLKCEVVDRQKTPSMTSGHPLGSVHGIHASTFGHTSRDCVCLADHCTYEDNDVFPGIE